MQIKQPQVIGKMSVGMQWNDSQTIGIQPLDTTSILVSLLASENQLNKWESLTNKVQQFFCSQKTNKNRSKNTILNFVAQYKLHLPKQ